MEHLKKQWLYYKQLEDLAIKNRREIEDKIVNDLKITTKFLYDDLHFWNGFKIRTRQKIKINKQKVRTIFIDLNRLDLLPYVFKTESFLNFKNFKQLPDDLKKQIGMAFTFIPKRPSFTPINEEDI